MCACVFLGIIVSTVCRSELLQMLMCSPWIHYWKDSWMHQIDLSFFSILAIKKRKFFSFILKGSRIFSGHWFTFHVAGTGTGAICCFPSHITRKLGARHSRCDLHGCYDVGCCCGEWQLSLLCVPGLCFLLAVVPALSAV